MAQMGEQAHNGDSTETSLILRVQQNDAAAWERLSQLYGPVVYAWARKAGLQSDDLIVLVNGQAVASQSSVLEKLLEIDAVDPVRLTVVCGTELLNIVIEPLVAAESTKD